MREEVLAKCKGQSTCLSAYGDALRQLNHCDTTALQELTHPVFLVCKSSGKLFRGLNPNAFQEMQEVLKSFHAVTGGFPHIIGNSFMQPVDVVLPGQRPTLIHAHPVDTSSPIHRLQGMHASFRFAFDDDQLTQLLGRAPRTYESTYHTSNALCLLKTPFASSLNVSFALDKQEAHVMPPHAGPEFNPGNKMFKELIQLMCFPNPALRIKLDDYGSNRQEMDHLYQTLVAHLTQRHDDQLYYRADEHYTHTERLDEVRVDLLCITQWVKDHDPAATQWLRAKLDAKAVGKQIFENRDTIQRLWYMPAGQIDAVEPGVSDAEEKDLLWDRRS